MIIMVLTCQKESNRWQHSQSGPTHKPEVDRIQTLSVGKLNVVIFVYYLLAFIMPSTCCSAFKCSERGGHLFPSDLTLRKAWIDGVSRKNWQPSKSSLLCKKHFREEDYITETKKDGGSD